MHFDLPLYLEVTAAIVAAVLVVGSVILLFIAPRAVRVVSWLYLGLNLLILFNRLGALVEDFWYPSFTAIFAAACIAGVGLSAMVLALVVTKRNI
ncbi:MAG: hypothetical protein WC457_05005 [Patescibacteria group bacterium]